MKKTTLITLLTACIFTLSSCGDVLAPLGGNPPTAPGSGGPPSTNPPVGEPPAGDPQAPVKPFNPACPMPWATSPLEAYCTDDDGTPLPIGPVDAAVITYLNELRTRGTLRGSVTTASGVNIFENTCEAAQYVKAHQGSLPALPHESHLHYAAVQHSRYAAHHELGSGNENTHMEDPSLPLYYGETASSRMHRAGGFPVNTNFYSGENMTTWKRSGPYMAPEQTAYITVLGMLQSPGHCTIMLDKNRGYMGAAFVKSANNYEVITIDFVFMP